MKNRHISTFPFLHASNSETLHLLLPSQQRFHKLCFLQKLCCQKPCWDQARLSSLVNKQVAQSPHSLNTFFPANLSITPSHNLPIPPILQFPNSLIPPSSNPQAAIFPEPPHYPIFQSPYPTISDQQLSF